MQLDEIQKVLQQGLTIVESIIQKLGKLSLWQPDFSSFHKSIICIYIVFGYVSAHSGIISMKITTKFKYFYL